MKVGLIILAAIMIALSVLIVFIPISAAEASRDSWRYNAHSRSIDIDICIRCTSSVPGPPGPQGPQGPPGDTHQTIVTLHDDAEGNAAGWNPPFSNDISIKSPIDLTTETGLSFEATFIETQPEIPNNRNLRQWGMCQSDSIDIAADTFELNCETQSTIKEGAILTYIITEP